MLKMIIFISAIFVSWIIKTINGLYCIKIKKEGQIRKYLTLITKLIKYKTKSRK